ncbi:MAG: hypothetical protein KGS47_11135 [Chloroflexi bacterium]|nr:hypothetical protein [Chloroflexota bacterium]
MIRRVGMFATVHNRRGLMTSVEPYDGPSGRLQHVTIENKDDQLSRDERLIRELERAGQPLEPTTLSNVARGQPMPADAADALQRAARRSAAWPFLDPGGAEPLGRLPFAAGAAWPPPTCCTLLNPALPGWSVDRRSVAD